MNCCKSMSHALENGYLEELVSYNKHGKRLSVGIVVRISGTPAPAFKLDICPWCGDKIQSAEPPHPAEAANAATAQSTENKLGSDVGEAA